MKEIDHAFADFILTPQRSLFYLMFILYFISSISHPFFEYILFKILIYWYVKRDIVIPNAKNIIIFENNKRNFINKNG